MNTTTDREYLTIEESGKRAHVTTRTIHRWIKSGALPAKRYGGRWRIDPVDLDQFGKVNAPTEPERGAAFLTAQWHGLQNPLLPDESFWLVSFHHKNDPAFKGELQLYRKDEDSLGVGETLHAFFFHRLSILYGRFYATKDKRAEVLNILNEYLLSRNKWRFYSGPTVVNGQISAPEKDTTEIKFAWIEMLRDEIEKHQGAVDVDLFPLRKKIEEMEANNEQANK